MHSIQCKCGTLRGEVDCSGTHNRIICYCTDCRAFAGFLGNAPDVLDQQGGTEIVQIAQSHLRFLQGEECLAAVRLSERGMLRWYASCCDTPIGNTMANAKVAFIGLIHSCLSAERINDDFGSKVALVNTDTALGKPQPKQRGLLGVIARFMWIVLTSRISGSYKTSPLFDAAGLPRVAPKILSAEELAALKNAA
ncbi:DUF6151 family protein [Rheinheimera gaetbuli]